MPTDIQRLAVVGATGVLGRPVAEELIAAGYEVTVASRSLSSVQAAFPDAQHAACDLLDRESVRRLLEGQDGVYLSLGVRRDERPDEPHAETDGLLNVVAVGRELGLRRIGLLASLVQRYQGMNGFDWWVFRMKEEAVRILREGGVPYTLFYASTFMESFTDHYRVGKRILLAGHSEHAQYFIAAHDYGRQVARAFALDAAADQTYVVQGPEPFTTDEAAEVFVRACPADVTISRAPLGLLQFAGRFSRAASYGAHIIEALNRYPEQFEAEQTWRDLGRPTTTLEAFARTAE